METLWFFYFAHEDSVTLMDILFHFIHKISHSLDPHSSRSSANACGLRRDFGSNPRGPRSTNKNNPCGLFLVLRAHEDSNLGQRFWKPAFYHWTIGPFYYFVSSLYITLRVGILISSDTREVEACLHFRVSAEIKKIVHNFLSTEL